jgi:hypothetical protein
MKDTWTKLIFVFIFISCVFFAGYNYHKYKNKNIVTKTRIDTIYVEKEGKIDTLWHTETKIETLHTETVVQGKTIIETILDTVYVQSQQLVASVDTVFVSADSLMKSDLSVKYNLTTNRFWINNVLSHTYESQISVIQPRKNVSSVLIALGDKDSMELGFGLSVKLSDRVHIGVGYTTEKRFMLLGNIELF